MDEQKTAVPAAASGPVTLDDVRNALGDIAPAQTNASKLRAIIGKGSFATIQKHLDSLRAQRIAAAQPVAEQSIPKPPQDAVEMLWAAAWGAAQTKTLARLEGLSAERDGLLMQLQSQAADIASLAEQLDTLEGLFQSQATALKVAQEAAIAQVQSVTDTLAVESDLLALTKAALVATQTAAEHAAALAVRDAQIERQTMQMTIERLTDQLSESKALHIAAAMQPAPAAGPKPVAKEKNSHV